MLFRYAALIERLVALFGEGICVQSDERILCAVLLERVIEGKEAGEVCSVGNESRPYCADVSIALPNAPRQISNIPFFDSTPAAGAVVALVVADMITYNTCVKCARANKVITGYTKLVKTTSVVD